MALTYEDGAWGSWDDAPDDDLDDLRRSYQFQYVKDIDYILGTCAVYTRLKHRPRIPCDYMFLCTLSITEDTIYIVWVKSFPDLLQFFKEIGTSSAAESLMVVLSDLSRALVNLLETFLESEEDDDE